jgi:general secretion pathway protein J
LPAAYGFARHRLSASPIPNAAARPCKGFSLVELLVAVAVFAALAAAAYGGLSAIARTRGALVAQQDRFAAVTRAVGMLERDLRQAVARPVRDPSGLMLPALVGRGDGVELTRLGFADPRREAGSSLVRVGVARDGRVLRRSRHAVLDRAPGSVPESSVLLDAVDGFTLRYLGADGAWLASWPAAGIDADALPRAVELRLALADLGEIRRVLELVHPPRAAPAAQAP